MIYCVISLVFSISSLIITILKMFTEDIGESWLRFFGNTELTVCLSVSIIMIILGLISDKRKDKELYE